MYVYILRMWYMSLCDVMLYIEILQIGLDHQWLLLLCVCVRVYVCVTYSCNLCICSFVYVHVHVRV